MSMKSKTILTTEKFILLRNINHATGRVSYTVETVWWIKPSFAAELRAHFDPGGNRGSKYSAKWKFRDRKTAEQLIMTAMLKFG
jgi:hypothetical protein